MVTNSWRVSRRSRSYSGDCIPVSPVFQYGEVIMYTRGIFGAAAAATVLALGALFGSAGPASAATFCEGASCHGLDPASTYSSSTHTLCAADAVTEDPTTPSTARPYIDIRYSADCQAAWMRVIGVPQGAGLHLRVTGTLDGTIDSLNDVVSYGNVLNYTFMVNAPDGLRGTHCNDIVTVSATADYQGLASAFDTPRINIGGVTC
jgi:hypothetical protein